MKANFIWGNSECLDDMDCMVIDDMERVVLLIGENSRSHRLVYNNSCILLPLHIE